MSLRVIVLLLSMSVSSFAAGEQRPGVSLFDGRTLDGWQGTPGVWRVENGAITAAIPEGGRLPRNEFLYWKDEVDDFDLTLEFRLTGHPSANSGIQFRSQKDETGHAKGYQADIDLGAKWLGCIYDEHGRALLVERGTRVGIASDGRRNVQTFAPAASFRALFRENDWNTYRISARGSQVEIRINGTVVAALDDRQEGEADRAGLLALQLHSGAGPVKVQFRNLVLTPAGPAGGGSVTAP